MAVVRLGGEEAGVVHDGVDTGLQLGGEPALTRLEWGQVAFQAGQAQVGSRLARRW